MLHALADDLDIGLRRLGKVRVFENRVHGVRTVLRARPFAHIERHAHAVVVGHLQQRLVDPQAAQPIDQRADRQRACDRAIAR
jgi:hypothetical protein